MVLVCVMALVKNNQINFGHICKAMHQQIVELLCHRNEDIMLVEFLPPSIKFGVVLAALFLSTEVPAND